MITKKPVTLSRRAPTQEFSPARDREGYYTLFFLICIPPRANERVVDVVKAHGSLSLGLTTF